MKTQIIAKIDSLSIDIDCLPEQQLWPRIDSVFSNKYEVLETIDYFLAHLVEDHNIPGNVWDTLIGIGHWIRDNRPLTEKQERYVVVSLAAYWDQRDLFTFDYA
jgi:hypothetical protein